MSDLRDGAGSGGEANGSRQGAGVPGGRRWLWPLVLVLGILIPQVGLYWGSLTGRTVLLPVDSIAASMPGLYADATMEDVYRLGQPQWPSGTDAILVNEPVRRYGAAEVHAGRLPAWNPYNFAGAPFIGNGQSAVFSPYRLIEFLSLDPVVLAWSELAKALVAGLGMYVFLRHGLRLSWLAGAAGAWLFPLSGFLSIWNGTPMAAAATWMGWTLFATELCVRRMGWKGPALLAVFTAFVCFAGHPQVLGHTLILSGVYMVWRVVGEWWGKSRASSALRLAPEREEGAGRLALRSVGGCVAGWGLGLGLAAIQLVPQVIYLMESNRWQMRKSGVIERPPLGLQTLSQVVQPWLCGEVSPSTVFLLPNSRYESGATAYAGLLVLFVLAPLAWRLKRWRGQAWFWGAVAVAGISQVANLPILSKLMMLPPLGMLSANRMTCLTAFALVVLGALGVNAAVRAWGRARPWVWGYWPVAAAIGAAGVLVAQMGGLERRILEKMAQGGQETGSAQGQAALREIQAWFTWQYGVALVLLAAAGVLFAALMRTGPKARRAIVAAVLLVSMGEMTGMAKQAYAQVDRRWYPDAPALVARLKDLGPGRVLSVSTFLPNLNLWWGVESAMGYDALDPVGVTRLLLSAASNPLTRTHASIVEFGPVMRLGVLKAMNVRYLASFERLGGFGEARINSVMFYVYEVPGWMPRAYVPRHVRSVKEEGRVLEIMNHPEFEPGMLGLVSGEKKVEFDEVKGRAQARMISPGRMEVEVEMETPGLLVLADAYDKDWVATYQGQAVEVLKVNYALRGVALEAGKGTVVFEYKPRGLYWGAVVSGLAGVVLVGWMVMGRGKSHD